MPRVGLEFTSPFVKCQGMSKYTNDMIRCRERKVTSDKTA